MSFETIVILITFGLYLFAMLAIGWYYYQKTKNLSDYILGGRKLNAWVTSLSAQASDMSGWLLLGLPGYAYLSGLESVWLLIGLLIGTYANWKFIAERLRKYTSIAGDAITLPDYFQNRLRANSNLLRILASIFILVFFLIYTSSGFVAGAKLFSSVFNISYLNALLIGGFVIVGYTFLGGFLAVSWTDVIQGTIMFFAIIIVPILGIIHLGGIEQTFVQLEHSNTNLLNMFTNNKGDSISVLAVFSLFGWGLGYFGQPHILARFMAIRDSSEIKKSRKIAMVWVVISLICAVILGMVGALVTSNSLAGSDSEKIFIVMVHQLVNPIFAGVLLAAILAAIMSTADSQLLVATSSLTEDIYKPYLRPNASQFELVWVSRLFVIIIAVISILIGMDPNSSVLDLVSYAWAGFGATFGPIIILTLYWSKISYRGAVAGMLVGGITIIIWKNLSGGIFELYEIIPGFLLSTISIYLVSKFDKIDNQQIQKEFQLLQMK